jgi:hypothetical protein
MRKHSRLLALLALLMAEAVAVVAVLGLGTRPPFDLPLDRLDPWLRASPGDALVAALRVVALASAAWLYVVTVAYACARASGVPAAIRACERATPRAVRRVVDRALAASIVVSAFVSPLRVGADPGPRASLDVRDGRDAATRSVTVPPVGSIPAPPSDAAGPPVVTAAPVVESVVVAPGNNLWDISAAALARATGQERAGLTDDGIAAYWLQVCDRNRNTLRSGDVNLIYPGEVVELPPVP